MLNSTEKARELRRKIQGDSSRCLDVEKLAVALNCDIEDCGDGDLGWGVEGALLPDPTEDRFVIQVDPTPPSGWEGLPGQVTSSLRRHRRRFRIAHEIAHTCFYARDKGRPPERSDAPTKAEERFCDEFARAILVPPEAARAIAPTADSAFELADTFDVSLEVGARALSAAHPELTIALWFWRPGKDASPGSLLRQWSNADRTPSLRRWRVSDVVAQAFEREKMTWGILPPIHNSGSHEQRVTARANHTRRQLLATGAAAHFD